SVSSSWFTPISITNSNINKLQISYDSVAVDTIIGGIIDSLKYFSVQACNNTTPISSVYNGQKIILSKNHGFTTMVIFNDRNETPAKLIGFSTNVAQEGFYYPDFSDYFKLNSGDNIIWKEE